MKKKDLTGLRFGKLVVLREIKNRTGYKKIQWECKCDCGNNTIAVSSHLISGHTKSCNCLQREAVRRINNSTHNLSKSRLYRVWSSMKSRCYYPKNESYYQYGKREISVCEEWKNDFSSFYNWSINNGYNDKLSIDRIDNNGNYCPENCRWATLVEQANNMSNNVRLTYHGYTKTLKEWSRALGISYNILAKKYKKVGINEILKAEKL
jgi:hypothetical protein